MDIETANKLEMKSREESESYYPSCNDSSQLTSRFQVAPVDDASNTDDERDEFSSPVGSWAQRTYGNNSTTMYDTRNLKSLRHYTRDALPRIDNYRNLLSVHGHLARPTMDELHGVQTTQMLESVSKLRLSLLYCVMCSQCGECSVNRHTSPLNIRFDTRAIVNGSC